MKRAILLFGAALLWSGAFPASAAPAPEVLLEGPGMRLVLENGRVRIFGPTDLAVEVRSFEFNFHAPASMTVGERAPDRVTLKAVFPAEADYAGAVAGLPVDILVERVAAASGSVRRRRGPRTSRCG